MRSFFCVVPFTPSSCGFSRNLSFRLGSGSNGFHYRHGNGSKGCRDTWSHRDGHVAGARSDLHRPDKRQRSLSDLPTSRWRLCRQGREKRILLASYPAFVLSLNQVARIDVAMKVGQASETVEVTGAAPLLATETTQVDTVINSATNDNLPLASRNYVQLTLLAPGAVSTDPSSFSNGNNTGGYGGRPLINGNREQANNFMLDGMDNNQVSDNLLGYTPAPDAIQEFNLITSNAPAEFGNFEGGIVNATIKSGTNAFHGDVWEFFRNDVLNANSWSNNLHENSSGEWDPLPKSTLRWNMFGGTVGGPILKNRLFFFADYQDQRFDIPSSRGRQDGFHRC